MSMLCEKTSPWLRRQELFESATATAAEIDQTRIDYEARRTADVPFGEYEFALRQPIGREITLRATEWDKVVKTPALIWLKTFLGVENQEPDLNQWNLATGTWVHDWLAQVAAAKEQNVFVDFPATAEIRERLNRAAQAFRQLIVDLCAA